MPDARRLVEVRALRQGTGYLITERLVLTAWHVIRPEPGEAAPSVVRVRVEGRIAPGSEPASAEQDAEVIWPEGDPGEDLDFALLRLSDPFPAQAGAWAPLDGAGRIEVHAIGYPDASIDRSRRTRDTREVSGWTHLGDRVRERKAGKGTFAIRLRDEDQPEGSPASAWPAMSGAAVFAGEVLVGIIRLAEKRNERGVLEALPVERLFGRPDVIEAVRRADCVLPARIPSLKAGDGHRLTYHWPPTWDFEPYMEEKRGDGFEGREWLFDEINHWLTAGNGRTLLIRADFGVGKSALLSEYVMRHRGRHVVAWHFCQHDAQATLRPEVFVRSIAAQLGDTLPAYRVLVEDSLELQKRLDEADADPASTLEAAVLAPLARMPTPGRKLLVVDALDEGLELEGGRKHKHCRRITLVDLLARKAARFPPWLRLLLSSRPHPQVVTPLRAASTLKHIDAESAGNLDDLQRFVLGQVARLSLSDRLREASITPQDFAQTLLRLSGGKFLFVVHALRDLAAGALSVKELAGLPPGMDAFYLDAFERRFGPDAESYASARELLGVMCAAREPLSREEMAEILGGGEQKVRTLQSRLPDFLRLRADRLNFSHASLKEWLTQENEEGLPRAGCFAVDLEEGASRLRRWALSRVKTGAVHASAYLLRNLATHLKDSAERRRIYAELLLTRFEWSQARLDSSGVPGLLADVEWLKGHPDQSLLRDLVRNSELVLRRSTAQWSAQVLGRLGGREDSGFGLHELVSSAVRWLSSRSGPLEILVPSTRSLRWIMGQELLLEGSPPLLMLPRGRIASAGPDHSIQVWEGLHGTEPRVLNGHTNDVLALALLPDGRIASGSRDRTLRIWDPAGEGEPVAVRKLSGAILALAVLPDGRIAAGCLDGQVWVSSPRPKDRPVLLEGHSAEVRTVVALPDGRIASGGDDGNVRVWELTREAEPLVLEGHSSRVVALKALPDGRLISSSWDCTVRVWDLRGRTEPRVLEGHSGAAGPLAVLPDGRIASGSDDGTVRVWNLARETEPLVLEGHSGWVWALAVLPDGRIVSGARDHTVRVWDPTGRADPLLFHGHSDAVEALAVLPDGRILSGGRDQTLRVWDPARRAAPMHPGSSTSSVETLAVLPDGRLLHSTDDHGMHLYPPSQPADRIIFRGHAAEVRAFAILPDGRIASAARDRTVRVWDPHQPAEPLVLKGHAGAVEALAVLPDGRLVSCGYDRSVRVWDPRGTAEPLVFKGHSDRVRVLAVLPDGRVASGSLDHTVRIWDPRQPAAPLVLEGHSSRVRALAVLADGRIVSGSRDRTVRVWDATGTTEPVVLEGHAGEIKVLAVLPDGRIVSGSVDCTVRVWDPQGAQEPRVLRGHTGEIRAIVVLPDGCVVSGAMDSTVRLWSQTHETLQSFIADAPVRCLALSRTLILAGCADGTIHALSREGWPADAALPCQGVEKSGARGRGPRTMRAASADGLKPG